MSEDRNNPSRTASNIVMNIFKYTLRYLNNFIEESQIEERKVADEFNNISSENKELKTDNQRLVMKASNLLRYHLLNRTNNSHSSSTDRCNQPNYSNPQLELTDKVICLEHSLQESQQSCDQLLNEVSEVEKSKHKLPPEVASLNFNTDTHYNGTSSLPQHHTLMGEYKDLKEQCLGPLETILFELMRQRDPELKRKERINDIKAIISESILISGHRIMLRDRTRSMEPVTEQPKLDPDKNLSPEVEESQTKSSKFEKELPYSPAGEWQERDFQQAYSELSDRFYSQLELDLKDLDPKMQTEIEAAIEKILQFLNRAALAEPPPNFEMIEKGASFDPVWHEAANDYKDAGKIVKMIYPAYLVNNKPKVQAIVLTEP
jgi:hypothetical protein